jgi:hypothetical protein
MLVLEDVYFNFVNSIDSEVTRKTYEYLMSKFLKYCNLDLDSLLRLSQQEHIKPEHKEDKIRVIESHLIEKGDPNSIVNLCWDIWRKYGYMNTVFFIDGSNRAMVNLLKIRWEEGLSWESKQSFGDNIRIRPVNFSTEHRNMLSNLHAIISKGYLAIEEKHDKLLTSLRTAYAEELNLKKEQTSYSDLLDGLRLALKGYNIE